MKKRFIDRQIKNRYLIYFILAGFFLGSFLGAFLHTASAGGTGSCQPTATGSYKNEWTNPTNAYTQNNVYAVGTTGTADEQDYYNFNFAFTNFNSVLGIVVSIDGYASSTLCSYKLKLSWDAGISWTSVKQSSNLGTSDTNNYVNIGTSTDTWGHTWTESQLSNANFRCYLQVYNTFSGRTIYTDHLYIYIYYGGYPSEPTNFKSISLSNSKSVNLSWLGALYNFDDMHDYTRIQRSTSTYPTSISSGTNICNYTGSLTPYYIDATTNYDTLYYYSAWSYNATYHLWSISCITSEVRTSCNTALTVYNNTAYITGKYQTSYNNVTGNKIWLNYTGVIPVLTQYSNIINATGTHQYIWSNSLWKYFDWANYTGDTTPIHLTQIKHYVTGGTSYILNGTGYYVLTNVTGQRPSLNTYYNLINCSGTTQYQFIEDGYERIMNIWVNYTGDTCNITDIHLLENIVNATGTHNYILNSTGYYVWANYTGNTTNCSIPSIHLIQNIINATGTHQYILNLTGYYVFANYTGSSGGCYGLVWVNYTDSNLTFNVSVDKSTNANTSSYYINDNNWLYMGAMLVLDNAQLFLLITISLWAFLVSEYLKNKSVVLGFVQFGFSFPLTIVIAVLSLSFAFGFIIVFLVPTLSLYLLVDSIYIREKSKKQK